MHQPSERSFYTNVDTRSRVSGNIRDYLRLYDGPEGGAEARKARYAEMINKYYDIATDFYEYSWGKSFHFAPRYKGEGFEASLARCQHYFALRLGLAPGMRVLDIGCGVGGPMRSIARFSGATIEGVNNNDYQLEKLARYNQDEGLAHLCSAFKGDFMRLEGVADNTYDAAYALDATCHAPDKRGVFGQIFRVLAPGGLFAVHEWCMTGAYDVDNAKHRHIKQEIETGDSLPDLPTIPEVVEAAKDCGFELVEHYDSAERCDPETPWYLPIDHENLLALRGPVGRRVLTRALGVLETARILPRGSKAVSTMLNRGADSLVAGGKAGIFTPNYFMLARKPRQRVS